MKRVLIFVLLFLSANVYADKWDDFLKDSGFPKKVIDDGSLVSGKILDATVSYQIKNNDGIKGNFENSDSAKVTITNKKGKAISTNKFMTAVELRTWARENFTDIFGLIIGDNPKITSENIKELTQLASVVLLNKNID